MITGSADRSLRIWDISRQTYRQAAILRHSATANTVDVGIDSTIAATGHVDGGVRFWDIQAGDRSSDISGRDIARWEGHKSTLDCTMLHLSLTNLSSSDV